MRTSKVISLASVALGALMAQPALAQGQPAATASDENVIVVYGQGETRQVQEISDAEVRLLLPGTSVIRAIEKLPSVNIQSADAFGNYEWSARVTIRSFNQNQLGFTFDGIPLGDMSYGNHNGLHISRAISSENVGSVVVSQGAGSLGTNSTGNLGGTVETFSMDPLDRFAVEASATYGSDETMRGFARINAGSPDGARGYVSYGYGTTDKYKGDGTQDQHMVNAKLVVPVGTAEIDGWVGYSDRREQDYQDMSLDMIERLGYGWDNTFPDYERAIRYADIANNIDRGNNTTGAPGADGLSDLTGLPPSNPAAGYVFVDNVTSADDAYYDAAGLRQDLLAALGAKMPLGEVDLAVRGYYHDQSGRGLWGTPYTPSPNGVPLSIRTTEYEMDRYGVFGSAGFELGFNDIAVTAWWENNDFNQARRFYAFESRTEPGRSFRDFPEDPFYTQWEFDFVTKTAQYSFQDRIELGALTINLGTKGFRVHSEATSVVSSSFPSGTIVTEDWFQPHAGFNYTLTDDAEVFGGFTQATRAFAAATTTGPFSTTQAGFDAIRDTLEPEESDTYELGLRYNNSTFNGVVGVYLVNFRNRQLGVSSGAAIQGNPTILQNVGSVRALGFEAAGDLRVTDEVTLFASYSYNDATYQDDVIDSTGKVIAATADKTVVDTPEHMARGEVSYDNGSLFGRVAVNYMSERFFTFENDKSVEARAIVDATLGYRLTESIEVQLNATNLFDEEYVATVGSGGYGNRGDRQTLLVGAPQQFFATLRLSY